MIDPCGAPQRILSCISLQQMQPLCCLDGTEAAVTPVRVRGPSVGSQRPRRAGGGLKDILRVGSGLQGKNRLKHLSFWSVQFY